MICVILFYKCNKQPIGPTPPYICSSVKLDFNLIILLRPAWIIPFYLLEVTTLHNCKCIIASLEDIVMYIRLRGNLLEIITLH